MNARASESYWLIRRNELARCDLVLLLVRGDAKALARPHPGAASVLNIYPVNHAAEQVLFVLGHPSPRRMPRRIRFLLGRKHVGYQQPAT